VVAPAGGGGLVWGRQQRRHLGRRQVGDVGAVVSFRGDGQDLADRGGVLRVLAGGVREERVDRSQPGVAGGDPVAANRFQVGQESADDLCGQVGQVEVLRPCRACRGEELQQQPPGVAVGSHGVRAGAELAG
jgi:hypothetical protein